MPLRASALGFLLALFTSLAAVAQESVQDAQQDTVDEASHPHGDHPHAGIVADTSAFPLEELQMFADVFNQIRQGYVESVPDSKLFELAVQGMLSGLDPHSVFLKEKAFDSLQETTKGEFSGLGIEIGQDRGYVTIIAPIDGHPRKAALRPVMSF